MGEGVQSGRRKKRRKQQITVLRFLLTGQAVPRDLERSRGWHLWKVPQKQAFRSWLCPTRNVTVLLVFRKEAGW